MAIQLNPTIIWARDNQASAAFLAQVLGLPTPTQFGPFMEVKTANGVDLAFHTHRWRHRLPASTMPSWSARPSSTKSSAGSLSAACPIGRILCVASSARSTMPTADAVSTSPTLTATSWKSSLAPVAATHRGSERKASGVSGRRVVGDPVPLLRGPQRLSGAESRLGRSSQARVLRESAACEIAGDIACAES